MTGKDQEFLATKPAEDVGLTNRSPNQKGKLLQHKVPGLVPQRVVDCL